VILVPVKDLGRAKQRLASVLPQENRTKLAETMLEDVLDAINDWPEHPPVGIVTSYAPAIELARRLRFEVIEDRDNLGESEAIAMATRIAVQRGATETMVIPGDMPLVTAAELSAVYAAAPREGIVLVPASDGRGSNAVLRRPASLIPLHFGNDSFIPHRDAARATGKPVVILEFPGIGLDIDTPEDLGALMAAPIRSRTQALLAKWNVAGRATTPHHA
jgi:2-phospho-L-lactate guanylyltransferase